MENESGIFEDLDRDFQTQDKYHDPVLILCTPYANLYRISRDGKYFFIKAVIPGNQRSYKYLRREYEIGRGCDHPNIVHVYAFESDTPVGAGLLTEYIDGRNLKEFLAENPDSATKRKVFRQLLEAVGYLHSLRIVHNDLKPENILVSYNGNRVKLIDFGLSDDDSHYLIKTPGCTPLYAAPELLTRANPDYRSDIYSIGLIMKELFGKKYRNISNKCLRKNPVRRYSSIEALKKRWDRRQWVWILPVALILLVIGACILIAVTGQEDSRLQKVEEMESAIDSHSQELKEQEKALGVLGASYLNTKDSLNKETEKARDIENRNKLEIESFKKSLESITQISLDSLRKCKFPMEMLSIFDNYVFQVKKLYDERINNTEDESLKSAYTAIMTQEFRTYDEVLQEAIREGTERVNESMAE